MCAGIAWLKPKGFAKPWVHGLPLGMGWWSRGIMAAIKKKARVGASECVPQGQSSVKKKHGYLTGLAWVGGESGNSESPVLSRVGGVGVCAIKAE